MSDICHFPAAVSTAARGQQPRGGVQRVEKPVVGRYVRAGDGIEQCGLARVGIAHVNFGIIPPLDHRVKGKRNKNAELSQRSLAIIEEIREEVLSQ